MADQCVPIAHPPAEGEAKKRNVNLRKRVTRSPAESEGTSKVATNRNRKSAAKRKKTRGRESQSDIYLRIRDVKAAHQRAKRSRPPIKEKRREIHRQNERFRHQSLNQAIKELAQLVPRTDQRRVDTKQSIVQRTGDYMEYLNNKVSSMCSQLRLTTRAHNDSLIFNKPLTAAFDNHKEKFPGTKPINFTSLEGLLQDMHIGSRIYTVPEKHKKHKTGRALNDSKKESKKSCDTKKIKNRTTSQSVIKDCRMTRCTGDTSRTSLVSRATSMQGSALVTMNPLTPGYLGDSEESMSPLGWMSSADSLTQSQLSVPSQMSVPSQLPSDQESDVQKASEDIEAITMTLGISSIGRDHCYSSTYYSDLSEAIPFLLPKTSEAGLEADSVNPTSGEAQAHKSSTEGLSTEEPDPMLNCAGDCSSGDGGSASLVIAESWTSADDATVNTMAHICVEPLTLRELSEIIQYASPPAGDLTGQSVQVPGGHSGLQGHGIHLQHWPTSSDEKGDLPEIIAQNEPSGIKLHAPDDMAHCRSWNDGYQLFVRVNQPNFQQAWPHLSAADITNLLTQAWNDLPEDVRKIYSDKAREWITRGSADQTKSEQ